LKIRKPLVPLVVFGLVFSLGLILGLAVLASDPRIAYTPDSAEYLSGANDIARRGIAVIYDPPAHPELKLTVLWFSRPPVYPAILALISRLPFLPTLSWNFIALWGMTLTAAAALYLFLKRKVGGGWVPAIAISAISLPWAMTIMADNAFLLANALFLNAFLWFTEKPGWARAFLVLVLGILSSFTKPVGAFACSLVALAGLADRRARWFSLAITGALVGVVLLWSYRNQMLYGRFIFSQVTDFNMAFFNYPALLARETGENEFALRDSIIRDFGQEVSARGISGNERAKAVLLAEKAKAATGYIMARPVDYALCHLSYLPRALGSANLPIPRGRGHPRPGGGPPEHGPPPHGQAGGFSAAGVIGILARAACFVLTIVGIPFWWRKRKTQAIALILGLLWFLLSMGPAGDDRTSLPAVLFASVLAQGTGLALKGRIIAGRRRAEQ